jgi:hypothetical protein
VAEVVSLECARGNSFNDSASDGCASSATSTHTDVHPEFPSLRIPSAVIYQFGVEVTESSTNKQHHLSLQSHLCKLIEMGLTSGKFTVMWECTILDEGSRACCNSRCINHDKKQGMPDFQPD